jgi:hypothetical protein
VRAAAAASGLRGWLRAHPPVTPTSRESSRLGSRGPAARPGP